SGRAARSPPRRMAREKAPLRAPPGKAVGGGAAARILRGGTASVTDRTPVLRLAARPRLPDGSASSRPPRRPIRDGLREEAPTRARPLEGVLRGRLLAGASPRRGKAARMGGRLRAAPGGAARAQAEADAVARAADRDLARRERTAGEEVAASLLRAAGHR